MTKKAFPKSKKFINHPKSLVVRCLKIAIELDDPNTPQFIVYDTSGVHGIDPDSAITTSGIADIRSAWYSNRQ